MAGPTRALETRSRTARQPLWCAAVLLAATLPARAAPDITGSWQTPEGATVDIRSCGNAPCGKITDFRPLPGYSVKTAPDLKNRDPAKRSRKILGLTVLWKLKPKKDSWQGRIYDPRRGFSANATVTLDRPNRLTLRGCVRVLFQICETETWRRIK